MTVAVRHSCTPASGLHYPNHLQCNRYNHLGYLLRSECAIVIWRALTSENLECLAINSLVLPLSRQSHRCGDARRVNVRLHVRLHVSSHVGENVARVSECVRRRWLLRRSGLDLIVILH